MTRSSALEASASWNSGMASESEHLQGESAEEKAQKCEDNFGGQIKKGAADGKHWASKQVDNVKHQADKARGETNHKASDAKHKVEPKVDDAKSGVSGAIESVKDTVGFSHLACMTNTLVSWHEHCQTLQTLGSFPQVLSL